VGIRSRAAGFGFTVLCITGALVLLSAPLFGTRWAGPFAPLVPVAVGLLAGVGLFVAEKARFRGRLKELRERLAEAGLDAGRPARDGLAAYTDAHLLLLRCEYEWLQRRGGARAARLFEASFGFTPEDGFEAGPLNVAPGTEGARRLRQAWERRIVSRREYGMEPPALGLREDRAYSVFPREATVDVEIQAWNGCLSISRRLARERHDGEDVPEDVRQRMG
jgi:hypothetical protein